MLNSLCGLHALLFPGVKGTNLRVSEERCEQVEGHLWACFQKANYLAQCLAETPGNGRTFIQSAMNFLPLSSVHSESLQWLICVCGPGVRNQGLMHAMQVFYTELHPQPPSAILSTNYLLSFLSPSSSASCVSHFGSLQYSNYHTCFTEYSKLTNSSGLGL